METGFGLLFLLKEGKIILNNVGVFDKLGKLAYNSDLESLKSSVSNGKSLIASAITDKGVSTASDATFQTMANNIGSIASVPAGVTIMMKETISLTNKRSKVYKLNYDNYALMYYYASGDNDAGHTYAAYLYNTTATYLSDWTYANGSRTACMSLLPHLNNKVLTCSTGNYTDAEIMFWLFAW